MSKRTIIALCVIFALILGIGAACAISAVVISGGTGSSVSEVEDCDAEDRRNREAECGFVTPKKHSVKKKSKKRAFTGTVLQQNLA